MSKEDGGVPIVPAYSYGAYLATIPESAGDVNGYSGPAESLPAPASRSATSSMPSMPTEILSKIFLQVVEHSFTTFRTLPFNAAAVDLLNISGTSSRFRQVAIHDPALWARVPFLNGISRPFLDLILRRSQRHPLTLRFLEDSTLPDTVDIWSLIMTEYARVAVLYIEVSEASDATKSKVLLMMRSPALQDCFVKFHGRRNVRLDDLISNTLPPFSDDAPALRSLHFINCNLSPNLYAFPKLTELSVACVGDIITVRLFLLSIQDFFVLHDQFRLLHSLKLLNCIWPCRVAEFQALLLATPPLDLPILEELDLAGSIEVCDQVGAIFHIPDECTRNVTVIFHRNRQFSALDANKAVNGASRFISPSVRYLGCSAAIGSGHSHLRLLKAGGKYDTLCFDVDQLNFQVGGVVSFLIASLSIPTLPFQAPSITDLFLRLLWDSLSRRLGHTLSSIPSLHLSFGAHSSGPHILHDFFDALQNVDKLIVERLDIWDNPCFLAYPVKEILPGLKSLEVPLDDGTTPASLAGLIVITTGRATRTGSRVVPRGVRISSVGDPTRKPGSLLLVHFSVLENVEGCGFILAAKTVEIGGLGQLLTSTLTHGCSSGLGYKSLPSIIIAALLPRHVFPNAHHLLILPLGHLPIEPNTAKEPISLRLYKVLSTNFDDAGGFGHALRALRDTSTGHLTAKATATVH
ncbi:hypothetical protein DFP72DRAFT_1074020 [Ephemerocybe angulata]|uniref:F-box domain-containing protein n=1 Tax=Ephemerocybe angulata TaxID=980116 RepID=A0A8H6HMZ4_9AGAR|nr:hypothetical protein DFP72DRAFT_1074020 [Tulosesus angulatus]